MSQTKIFPLIFTTSLISLAFLLVASLAHADTTGTVTATVTVQNVSLTVTDGSVAYGTLAMNSSAGTNGSDTQTITNNGNVTETFTIHGTNTAAWTLDSVNTTAEHYVHRFCVSGCTTPPTSYTALTTNEQNVATGVAKDGTATFDLYLTTPQTTAVFTEQSPNVTITATAT